MSHKASDFDDGELLAEDPGNDWEQVPHGLMDDPRVTVGGYKIWSRIRRYGRKDGRRIPSRKELAEAEGKSTGTIDNWISNLIETGWLLVTPQFRRDKPGQTSNRYTLLYKPITSVDDPRAVAHRQAVDAFKRDLAGRMETNKAKRAEVTESDELAEGEGAAGDPSQNLGRGQEAVSDMAAPPRILGGAVPESWEGPSQELGNQDPHLPQPQQQEPQATAVLAVGELQDPQGTAPPASPPAPEPPRTRSSMLDDVTPGVRLVLEGLPAELQRALASQARRNTIPRTVVTAISEQLELRTPEQLVDRLHRRWRNVPGEIANAIALTKALVAAPSCPNVACEEGEILGAPGVPNRPCSACAERAANVDTVPAAPEQRRAAEQAPPPAEVPKPAQPTGYRPCCGRVSGCVCDQPRAAVVVDQADAPVALDPDALFASLVRARPSVRRVTLRGLPKAVSAELAARLKAEDDERAARALAAAETAEVDA